MIQPFPTQESMVASPGWSGFAQQTAEDRVLANLDFVCDLRRDFEERDKLYQLVDQCVFLEQKVKIPTNFADTAVETRSPLPRYITNQIVAALSINTPRVSFTPIKFGDEGEDEAAYRSKFFEASWRRQRREKQRNIYRLFMDSVVTKGDGWLKTFTRKNRAWAKYTEYSRQMLKELDAAVMRGDMDRAAKIQVWDAATEEFKRGQPYPIETTEVPPEHMYYQKGEDGFVRIAEVSAVPYFETLMRHQAALDERGRVVPFDNVTSQALPPSLWGDAWGKKYEGRKTLEKIEIWDAQKAMVILRGPGDIGKNLSRGSGFVVKEWSHGYGDEALGTLRGPYFHSPGILTASREPHKAHLSVIFAFLHLFPLLNSLLTMQSQAAFSFSYPAYKRASAPTYNLPDAPFGMAANDLEARRQKIVPGAIFPHDVVAMDQPHTTVDLDKAIQFVKAMIDLALPDTVQGVITGETVGYALNQAVHLASLQWSPIIDNAQIALGDRVGWESWLIDHEIGERVYVWGNVPQPRRKQGQEVIYKDGWMGIGPKELGGVHNYDVVLEPVSINNEELELRVIKAELDMRLMTPADAIRRRGRNPVEVERGWLLHEFKQDPLIRDALRKKVFEGLTLGDQTEMQQIPPGGEPGGTAPPETSGLPPGAQPGISQGLPVTGYVPPAGSVPPAAMPAPGDQGAPPMPGPPGVPRGAPGGTRGVPPGAETIPGGG